MLHHTPTQGSQLALREALFCNVSSPATKKLFTISKATTYGWALGEPGSASASASAVTTSSPPSTSFMMRCATLTSTCREPLNLGVMAVDVRNR